MRIDRSIGRHVAAVLVLASLWVSPAAHAATAWEWAYSGAGIDAAGTLLTNDTPDSSGVYQIVEVSGLRNGVAITGLYPTGSAIPGNEPFAVDNLIRLDGPGQLSLHGFGFSLQSGAHANPYFADFLPTPAYSEVFTTATSFSEVPITFHAAMVPEVSTSAMLLAGLGLLALARRRHNPAEPRLARKPTT